MRTIRHYIMVGGNSNDDMEGVCCALLDGECSQGFLFFFKEKTKREVNQVGLVSTTHHQSPSIIINMMKVVTLYHEHLLRG